VQTGDAMSAATPPREYTGDSPSDKDDEPIGMKRIGQHGLVYAAGILLLRAVSVLMLPLYTNYLTPADYGVIQLIEMTFEVISIVAGARLAVGIFRFYHKAETEAERRSVISTAMTLVVGLSAIVGVLAGLAAPRLSHLIFKSDTYTPLIQLGAASFVTQSLLIVPLAFLRAANKSMLFVRMNVIRAVLQMSLNILFLTQLGMGVAGIMLSTLVTSLAVGLLLSYDLAKQCGLGVSRAAARDLLTFGLPLVATQVATFVLTFGDRYFLQASADTTAVGLYSLSYQFGFMLSTLGYMPFSMVWEPMRFAIARQSNRDEMYARAFVYLNLLLLTMTVGIALFAGDLLRVMSAPAFHSAAAIVPFILVAYVFQAWYGIQDVGLHISERTGLITLANWVSGAVALLGYIVLIPRYAGLGAALATLASFAVRWVIVYRMSQKLWPVRYNWNAVGRLSAVAGVAVVTTYLIPKIHIVASIALHSLLFAAYALTVWSIGVLSDADRAVVRASPRLALGYLRNMRRRPA
jgi:O-antigen/teichoic acid export membrane protein